MMSSRRRGEDKQEGNISSETRGYHQGGFGGPPPA